MPATLASQNPRIERPSSIQTLGEPRTGEKGGRVPGCNSAPDSAYPFRRGGRPPEHAPGARIATDADTAAAAPQAGMLRVACGSRLKLGRVADAFLARQA